MNPSDFLAEPGSPAFEQCRCAVARELKWKPENVMDWEVRSYIRMKGEREASTKQFNQINREASGMTETAICTLCAAEPSPGFYTGCMVNDGHAPEWQCDGKGKLTKKSATPAVSHTVNEGETS